MAGLWWIIRSLFWLAMRYKKTAAVVIGIGLFVTVWNTVQYNRVLYSPIFSVVGETARSDHPKPAAPGVAIATVLADILQHQSERWTPNALYISPTWLMDNPQNYQMGQIETIRGVVTVLEQVIDSMGESDPNVTAARTEMTNDANSFLWPSFGDKLEKAAAHMRAYAEDLTSGKVKFTPVPATLEALTAKIETMLYREAQELDKAPRFSNKAHITTKTAGDTSIEGETMVSADDYHTPLLKIDDNFYHAQGMLYVVHHVMRALFVDFQDVIKANKSTDLGTALVIEMDPYYFETSPIVVMNCDPLSRWGCANHSTSLSENILNIRGHLDKFRRTAGSSNRG